MIRTLHIVLDTGTQISMKPVGAIGQRNKHPTAPFPFYPKRRGRMTNDPNSNIPSRDPDLRTTPEKRRRPSWVGWAATIAVIAVAAFAITEWLDEPDTDPSTTASTTASEPAPAPAKPMAPTDNNPTLAPAAPSHQ
jgi:hypothetical protein